MHLPLICTLKTDKILGLLCLQSFVEILSGKVELAYEAKNYLGKTLSVYYRINSFLHCSPQLAHCKIPKNYPSFSF